MKYPIILLFLMSVFCGFSQNENKFFPEKEASFPGGASEMNKFIAMEIQYPDLAVRNWDQGRVYVTFVVERNGSLSNIEVMRGGLTPELNAEAIRLISSMPRWLPGEIDGEAVRARCRLPITFVLGGRPSRRKRKELKRNR
ncbi:MAG: hypothetical protein COA38_15045 [Fluviicola sp.]|nr:MAG: hypothetical protein COA38_15045 [Fluviicola sp.]